ncbi:7201_t:CDS:2 [Paraglomus brasilianum]|uniref:7201_t:CDS:1 n=1 Tax=Paraglomus brasilianum TaxID=144538 RepID=A0A9N9FPL1_9GLOM|nr:7201_t:CDS:2 [Paraglomus brasilianum]
MSADEQTNVDSSTATFVSAVVFNGGITIGVYLAFSIIRSWNKRIFEPKTYLVEERKRSPPPGRFFGWVKSVLTVSQQDVINRAGLEAYLFLRFFKMCTSLFVLFSIVGVGILVPLNKFGKGGLNGLDQWSIGNIAGETKKLWAHLAVGYFIIITTIIAIFREYKSFIRLRHAYYVRPEHAKSAIATTILVVGIPPELYGTDSLKQMFDVFPGGVKKIWLNRDPLDIPKYIKEREQLVNKLETSALYVIAEYYRLRKAGKLFEEESGTIPEKLRPTHRKFVGIGSRVDSLETYRKEILRLNTKIDKMQKESSRYPPMNSAFIQFNTQLGAQLASSATIPRLKEITPDNVVWDNLNVTYFQKLRKRIVVTIIVTALVLLWAIPVATVTTISQLDRLQKQFPFLDFVNNLPKAVIGIIQGVLPAAALAVLLALVPIILRFLSKQEGIVTYSGITASVQAKYFFFLVVNVLLVTTFSSGVSSALPALIKNPTSAIDILGKQLPLASAFFISYVLLSLSGAALRVTQLGTLVVYWIFRKFLAKTPRRIYEVETTLGSMDWGTAFPPHVLIACIGFVYSTVAPIILPIVALHFFLHYISYSYLFLYVLDQPEQATGEAYSTAIYELFTGMIIYELTMGGLLFLKQAFIQGALMIFLAICTVGILLVMKSFFKHNPSVEFLPADLAGLVDTKRNKVLVEAVQNEHIEEYVEGHTEHIDDDAYTHPAFAASQPIIWLPQDKVGIAQIEANECQKDGLPVSTEGAVFDESGRVVVEKGPPEARPYTYV